ncbi:hypothetical protein DITRI_Ditri11bG0085800 [Diplodiscus trichospermus]
MEAKMLAQSRSLSPIAPASRRIHKEGCSSIVAVLARPAENIAGITEKLIIRPAESKTEVAPKTSVPNDKWFDLIAINHLSQSLQSATGLKSRKSGYESLVEVASLMSKKFNPSRQQELVIQTLNSVIPKIILNMIKTLLPESQFKREYFAAFTTVFFAWLVGPSEVKESELNGRREKNVVHVKKCRFLEQSNCVGMCINLCKMPSQAFIKDSMGMPVNMVPNFDDMSCEMIFGQNPPASNDDPALKQPCYKLCRAKQKHTVKCTS